MKSLSLGIYFGIPVKVHWTFSLLVLYIVYTLWADQVSYTRSLWFIGYVATLFICVIFHEYGHALVARRFGIGTEDIILSPIGGVARLKNIPDKPKQEIWIALAGPLVNVFLALVCIGSVLILGYTKIGIPDDPFTEAFNIQHFLLNVGIINIVLFVFNMIPAFPMDGGRVLRSALTFKFGRLKATYLAMIVGRVIAVGFIIICFFWQQYTLGLIGVFIFLSSRVEHQSLKRDTLLDEIKLEDVVKRSFTKLHIGDTYDTPIDLYRRNIESNFLVYDSLGYVVGCVPELFIKDTLQTKTNDKSVSTMLSSAWSIVDINQNLKSIYEVMNSQGIAIILVKDGDIEIGVIDRNTFYNLAK
jgi:Zn-dependent protease/predicted transcriptional regulator